MIIDFTDNELSSEEIALLDKICNRGSVLVSSVELDALSALMRRGLINVSASLEGMQLWTQLRRSQKVSGS